MFTLVSYTPCSRGVVKRSRLPGTYPTASAARAAGVALLGAERAIGFEVEHTSLQAANDSATQAQRIERAKAARKARAAHKSNQGE